MPGWWPGLFIVVIMVNLYYSRIMSMESKADKPEFKERLVQEALALCRESGVRGWNMDDLSRRVGVARNTLYRMSPSREDILRQVALGTVRQTQERLGAFMTLPMPWMDRARKVLELFPSLLAGATVAYLSEIVRHYPTIGSDLALHRDGATRALIAFLDQGVTEGVLKGDLDGELRFHILKGVVLHWIGGGRDSSPAEPSRPSPGASSPDPVRLARELAAVLESLLEGWKVPEGTPAGGASCIW